MHSEIKTFLKCRRSALLAVLALTVTGNILALTGSVFMLAVYDRVIPSGSVQTLVALGAIAFAVYWVQAAIDIMRGRILTRIGLSLRDFFSARVHDLVVRRGAAGDPDASNAAHDLRELQAFLSSSAPATFFDLCAMPVYLLVLFFIHPAIAGAVIAGGSLLIAVSLAGGAAASAPSSRLRNAEGRHATALDASRVDAATIVAMGMNNAMARRSRQLDRRALTEHQLAADTVTSYGTASRIIRMILQSLVLAVGAILVIYQEATGGVIIAATILSARALAPVEMATAQARSFIQYHGSRKRLELALAQSPVLEDRQSFPRPSRQMVVKNLFVALPHTGRLVVRDVSFSLSAGDGLGIVGRAGAGKTSLAAAVAGATSPTSGALLLDGRPITAMGPEERAMAIGYLPQAVRLFEGTLFENISRFEPDADPAKVERAVIAAGVTEVIDQLPDGLGFMLDARGGGLSGGQAQRVALARALYGEPFLVVLDEPNSNLDRRGESALNGAIRGIRNRGGIVVVVTHQESVLTELNRLVELSDGSVTRDVPSSLLHIAAKAARNPQSRRNDNYADSLETEHHGLDQGPFS